MKNTISIIIGMLLGAGLVAGSVVFLQESRPSEIHDDRATFHIQNATIMVDSYGNFVLKAESGVSEVEVKER